MPEQEQRADKFLSGGRKVGFVKKRVEFGAQIRPGHHLGTRLRPKQGRLGCGKELFKLGRGLIRHGRKLEDRTGSCQERSATVAKSSSGKPVFTSPPQVYYGYHPPPCCDWSPDTIAPHHFPPNKIPAQLSILVSDPGGRQRTLASEATSDKTVRSTWKG